MKTKYLKFIVATILAGLLTFFALYETENYNAMILKLTGLFALTSLALILERHSNLFKFKDDDEIKIKTYKYGIRFSGATEAFKLCETEAEAAFLINSYEQMDYWEGVYVPNKYEKICY